MTRFQVSERLYGGPYPEEIPPDVDFVVDLTEDGELTPYPCRCERRRLPIRDFGVPTHEELRRILNTIDDALGYGRTVFVHCRGGIGRTGRCSAPGCAGTGTPRKRRSRSSEVARRRTSSAS